MLVSVRGYGGTMRKYMFVALAALVASPVLASTDKEGSARSAGNPIDMLYPEIAVDDDGWRGLLPVILLNPDALSEQPKPAAEPGGQSKRSERR